MLHVGYAQKDITPPLPMLMGGAFLKYETDELHDPIMASCVVADDGRARVAYASCDLGSVSGDMVQSIRDRVCRVTGTPRENLFVMATHNHAGPTVQGRCDRPFADNDTSALIDRTRETLSENIAACMIRAHENRVPTRLGYGRGRFDSGAFNRRFIMSNGRSRMHGGGGFERLRPEGPVDRDVQTVWFEDPAGRPLAVMVSYAAHPANLYGSRTILADFPGFMRQTLQAVLGEDVPVLYLQGACGNIMCQDLETPNAPRGLANARRTGRGLAGEALRLMSENVPRREDVRVSACRRTVNIPFRENPPLPFAEAREKWAYYQTRWEEFLKLDIEERGAIHGALRLAGYKQAAAEEAEIAAFALGDVFFVTNPAELFVEYQLDVKERFKGRKVIMTEQTNGRISYVPTPLAHALGGYETIITRFGPGAGEMIRDTSCALLEQLIDGRDMQSAHSAERGKP